MSARQDTSDPGAVRRRQLLLFSAVAAVLLVVLAVWLGMGGGGHRPARVPDRDAAECPRALAVLAGTGLAARHPRRGRVAFDAAAPGPPLGVAPAAGSVFRLAVAPLLLGHGAGRAVGRAAVGGGLALDADPGGSPGIVAGARGVAAGLALGGPAGRPAAGRAVAPGSPFGIAPAVGFPLGLQVPPPFLGHGAGFAIGLAVRRGRRAIHAQAGGAALAMAGPGGVAAVVPARLAHRSSLFGRDGTAADAKTGREAGFAAPAAALPAGPAPGYRVASAIRYPLGLGPGVTSAVTGAVLLRAGLAGRAIGPRRSPAAFRADAGGLALGVLAATTLTLVALRLFRVAYGLALGPEPGGPRAVGGAAPLRTGLAERALGRGLGLAASHAEPRCATLSGSPVIARKVVPAPGLDIAVSHNGLLPANPGVDGRTPRRQQAGRTSGKEAVSPSACGRTGFRRRSNPRPACRRGSSGQCR